MGLGAAATRTYRGTRLAALAAFPIEDHVRYEGVVRPRFTAAGSAVLAATEVLVTVERVLDEDVGVPRLACLGGSGYPHCVQVFHSRRWDRLVVPSASVLHELGPTPSQRECVDVIHNGVDTELFTPGDRQDEPCGGRSLRLLVPSRPGWEKGYRLAIRLGQTLQKRGQDVELICVRQHGFLKMGAFYRRLREEAADLPLRLLPWRGHRGMPGLYRKAQLTLCLSEVPEGFGLAAAESVACGTPVLAARSGFLTRMFPPDHGFYAVDSSAALSTLVAVAEEAATAGRRDCLARGRPYVVKNYNLARMRRAYAEVVASLLS
jgi:glycosyltransferase involved in cell wall biosynthesis